MKERNDNLWNVNGRPHASAGAGATEAAFSFHRSGAMSGASPFGDQPREVQDEYDWEKNPHKRPNMLDGLICQPEEICDTNVLCIASVDNEYAWRTGIVVQDDVDDVSRLSLMVAFESSSDSLTRTAWLRRDGVVRVDAVDSVVEQLLHIADSVRAADGSAPRHPPPSVEEQHHFLDAAKAYDWATVAKLCCLNRHYVNCQPSGRWSALHLAFWQAEEAVRSREAEKAARF